jgi:hypothetical protein
MVTSVNTNASWWPWGWWLGTCRESVWCGDLAKAWWGDVALEPPDREGSREWGKQERSQTLSSVVQKDTAASPGNVFDRQILWPPETCWIRGLTAGLATWVSASIPRDSNALKFENCLCRAHIAVQNKTWVIHTLTLSCVTLSLWRLALPICKIGIRMILCWCHGTCL